MTVDKNTLKLFNYILILINNKLYIHMYMMRYTSMYSVTPDILLKLSLWELIRKNLDSLLEM